LSSVVALYSMITYNRYSCLLHTSSGFGY